MFLFVVINAGDAPPYVHPTVLKTMRTPAINSNNPMIDYFQLIKSLFFFATGEFHLTSDKFLMNARAELVSLRSSTKNFWL